VGQAKPYVAIATMSERFTYIWFEKITHPPPARPVNWGERRWLAVRRGCAFMKYSSYIRARVRRWLRDKAAHLDRSTDGRCCLYIVELQPARTGRRTTTAAASTIHSSRSVLSRLGQRTVRAGGARATARAAVQRAPSRLDRPGGE
jgi:hypothetical protein